MKIALAVAAVSATLVGGQFASAGYYFPNSSSVNILERWNPVIGTPTFYLNPNDGMIHGNNMVANDGSNPQGTIDYSAPGNTWRVDKPGVGTKTATIRYTFDGPKLVNSVAVNFRADNHSPDNYTISDQNGVIVTHTLASRFPTGTITDSFANRQSNYIEYSMVLDTTGAPPTPNGYYLAEIPHIAAYVDGAAQPIAYDNTYNILWNPANTTKVAGSYTGDGGAWTDHVMGSNGAKPSDPQSIPNAGNPTAAFNPSFRDHVTYSLDQTYQTVGALIPQYDGGRYLPDAQIDVSLDGVTWTNVFTDTDSGPVVLNTPNSSALVNEWHFRGEDPTENLGYISWASTAANFVRLSWGDNPDDNPVEITEFQVFGSVPEPTCLAVLGIGMMGLFARRRRHIA